MQQDDQSQPLPKPLSDPLMAISVFFVVNTLLGAIIGLLTKNADAVLISCGGGFAITLLIAPFRRPNAIYLRAFKTDRSTSRLRAEISAVLGAEYRLAGIRPPRERSSDFRRFLIPGLVALQYAGSRYMELEAGHDWMARLWRTYRQVRVAFIDLRETTPYVHQEIQMTWLTLGPARCVFLIDSSKSIEQWRALLSEILNDLDRSAPGELKLLDVSPEQVRTGQMATTLRRYLADVAAAGDQDGEAGWQFVVSRMQPDLLQSFQFEQTSVVANVFKTGIALLVLLVGFLVLVYELPFVGMVVALIVAAPVVVLLAGAFLRAAAAAWRLGRNGHGTAAATGAVKLALVVLLACCFAYGQYDFVGQIIGGDNGAEPATAGATSGIGQDAPTTPAPTVFHSDQFHLDYMLPTFFHPNDEAEVRNRSLLGAVPKVGSCLSNLYTAVSDVDPRASIGVLSISGGCAGGKSATPIALMPNLLESLSGFEGRTKFTRPNHYTLFNYPVDEISGSISDGDAYVTAACISEGSGSSCWYLLAHECEDLSAMQEAQVKMDSSEDRLIPQRLKPECERELADELKNMH